MCRSGGGYQYRLCSAKENLTEACFMKTPLEFVRTAQALQWKNGTRLSIPGTWVDTGTMPAGSTWAKKSPMRTLVRWQAVGIWDLF